jgi:hypothetical protein
MAEHDLAAIGLLHARQDAQQRRFARAIRADHAHALALAQRQGRIAQDQMPTIGFTDSSRHQRDCG